MQSSAGYAIQRKSIEGHEECDYWELKILLTKIRIKIKNTDENCERYENTK
jgi:hypothetical protein